MKKIKEAALNMQYLLAGIAGTLTLIVVLWQIGTATPDLRQKQEAVTHNQILMEWVRNTNTIMDKLQAHIESQEGNPDKWSEVREAKNTYNRLLKYLNEEKPVGIPTRKEYGPWDKK